MSYDAPNYNVRDERFNAAVGGAASTEYAKFRMFQAARLKRVHAIVTVAGTTTGHALDVFHGTNSVGNIPLGLSAAGAIVRSAILNEIFPTLDQVSVKTRLDATGVADVIYEYERTQDGVVT